MKPQKITIFRELINEKIIEHLKSNYFGERSKEFEFEFTHKNTGREFFVNVIYEIDKHQCLIFNNSNVSVRRNDNSRWGQEVETKITRANQNPKAKLLDEMFEDFLTEWENDEYNSHKDSEAIEQTNDWLNKNYR